MFKKSIKKEVMKVLNTRFKSAQKAYNDSVNALKDQRFAGKIAILQECEDKLQTLNASHEASKSQLLDTQINNILSKIV